MCPQLISLIVASSNTVQLEIFEGSNMGRKNFMCVRRYNIFMDQCSPMKSEEEKKGKKTHEMYQLYSSACGS